MTLVERAAPCSLCKVVLLPPDRGEWGWAPVDRIDLQECKVCGKLEGYVGGWWVHGVHTGHRLQEARILQNDGRRRPFGRKRAPKRRHPKGFF